MKTTTNNQIELNKVFNYNIGKLEKKYKTIYIIINKNIKFEELLKHISIKQLNIALTTSFKSILNKILIEQIKETLLTITINKNKYNVIISLFDKEHIAPINLYHSLIRNNLRNINLLTINLNIYNFISKFLIYLYNYSNTIANLNFYFNILNNDINPIIINNIIIDSKTIFACKNNIAIKLEEINSLTKHFKTQTNSNTKLEYFEYKPNQVSNKFIIFTTKLSLINTLKYYLTNNIYKQSTNNIILITKPITKEELFSIFNNKNEKNYTFIEFNNSKNLVEYTENISTVITNKLLDTIIKNTMSITLIKNKDITTNKYMNINIKNSCLSIKLLSEI